jgi:hypothetical protein
MALSQPGIFNVLDYGMVSGNAVLAASNALALQAAINDAQGSSVVGGNSQGALVLIPSYSVTEMGEPQYGPYFIDPSELDNGSITIPDGGASSALLIMGTGGGTTLVMTAAASTMFLVQSSPFVAFQDLTVIDGSSETSDYTGTAFAFSPVGMGESDGYKLFRLNIQDFPIAVNIAQSVVAANLLQCSVSYDGSYSGVKCRSIVDSGAQTNIEQCSFVFATGGPTTGTIGIKVVGSSYARVTDTRVSGFETAIDFDSGSGGTVIGASLSGLDVDAVGSCVSIVKKVYDICFVNCSFGPTNPSSPPTVPGISIGNTDQNDYYDTICFTACTVTGYGGYGLAITMGQNIQVNGGTYSGNTQGGIAILGAASAIQITGANCIGSANGGGTQAYGIYITAGQDIQLTGVNCSGNSSSAIQIAGASLASVQNVRVAAAICDNSVLGVSSQQYGISVAGATGILIDGCSLMGNVLYAVKLSGVQNASLTSCDLYSGVTGAKGISISGSSANPTKFIFIRSCNGAGWSSPGVVNTNFITVGASHVSNVEVTDCPGYNDQAAILANTAHPPSTSFSGLDYSYYGPSAFYIASSSSSTTVSVDGTSTNLTSGSFSLAVGETAQVASNTSTSHFLMVGK